MSSAFAYLLIAVLILGAVALGVANLVSDMAVHVREATAR